MTTASVGLHDLILDCPFCDATGWVAAVSPSCGPDDRNSMPSIGLRASDLTLACPVCFGRSWVPAVAEEVTR